MRWRGAGAGSLQVVKAYGRLLAWMVILVVVVVVMVGGQKEEADSTTLIWSEKGVLG